MQGSNSSHCNSSGHIRHPQSWQPYCTKTVENGYGSCAQRHVVSRRVLKREDDHRRLHGCETGSIPTKAINSLYEVGCIQKSTSTNLTISIDTSHIVSIQYEVSSSDNKPGGLTLHFHVFSLSYSYLHRPMNHTWIPTTR